MANAIENYVTFFQGIDSIPVSKKTALVVYCDLNDGEFKDSVVDVGYLRNGRLTDESHTYDCITDCFNQKIMADLKTKTVYVQKSAQTAFNILYDTSEKVYNEFGGDYNKYIEVTGNAIAEEIERSFMDDENV